jgi:hypothetical protein
MVTKLQKKNIRRHFCKLAAETHRKIPKKAKIKVKKPERQPEKNTFNTEKKS